MLALTHVPSPQIQEGLRTFVKQAAIDYTRALLQHADYCRVLRECGVKVATLEVNRDLPDSVFIEDTAVILDEAAILCSLGAAARRDEPAGIEPHLRSYRDTIHRIDPPATFEGGDVLRVGRTLLVGESCRTNAAGIAALADIARPYGYRVQSVSVHGCLHLKTACTALPDETLLVNAHWLDMAALRDFASIAVPVAEPWGANVLLLGRTIILPADHRATADLLRRRGHDVREVDISEFAKLEGGVTCLSLLIA